MKHKISGAMMFGQKKHNATAQTRSPAKDADQPLIYQIRIRGQLGRQWIDRFDGLTIRLEENGDTLITGPVADQAALYGLLRKVRDLGMPLISVNVIGAGPAGSTL